MQRATTLRTIALWILAILIVALPFVWSAQTEQVFEVHKFLFFMRVNTIFVIITIASVFRRAARNRHDLPAIPLIALFLFLVSAALSMKFGPDPSQAFFGSNERHMGLLTWVHLGFFLMSVLLLKPMEEETKRFVAIPLLAAGVLQTMLAVTQHIDPRLMFSYLHTQEFLGRSFGTLGHPNFLGQFLLFPFFFGLEWMLTANTRQEKIRMLCLTMFLVLGITLTGSRAALLGVALGSLTLLFLSYRTRTANQQTTAAILILIVMSIVLMFGTYRGGTERNEKKRSVESRFAIWQQVPAIIADAPWFGVGLDNESYAFAAHRPEIAQLEDPQAIVDRAHNFFLDLLIQTGIVGTFLFLIFLFSSLLCAVKLPSTSALRAGLFAIIVAALTAWQFGFPVITDSVLFFLSLGLVVG